MTLKVQINEMNHDTPDYRMEIRMENPHGDIQTVTIHKGQGEFEDIKAIAQAAYSLGAHEKAIGGP
jgi:hypothetical protein